MNTINTKFGSMLASMALALAAGGTALADDTELFVAGGAGAESPEYRPNILFIIDTSGSMTSKVLTQEDWDADTTFEGCYSSSRLYYSYTNEQPACDSAKRVRKSRNLCKASYEDLNSFGVYRGNILGWRYDSNDEENSRWLPLSNENRYIECEADAGLHSYENGNWYAADGVEFPYENTDEKEPAWTENYYLWDGNYLNWLTSDGTTESTRIKVVKKVTDNLLQNMNGVNVGLMRFNYEDGGPVIHAMEDIETAREDMREKVANLPANTWTPLSETLYEAGQYYAGRSVDYGEGHTIDSVGASRTGGSSSATTYNSPIDFTCQKNFVVLLTDGAPTRDVGAETRVEGLPGFAEATGSAECSILAEGQNPDGTDEDGKCLDEMAAYMYNRDLSPLEGDQSVITYTIGFAVDLPLLEETAVRGGGEYYTADDTSTLSAALSQIVIDILDNAGTFSAPAVPVNAFNRTQNLSNIFVSLFAPSSTVRWPGNIKKYSLDGGRLFDANDRLAVNRETGFFKETAQSFWSTEVDGNRPAAGGAAEQLPDYTQRKLYSNLESGDLNAVGNQVGTSNMLISGPMLGSSGTQTVGEDGMTERERIIQWMRGLDVFDADDDGDKTDTRHQMGDPLHVKPVPVIYGGTEAEPDMVVYTSTNDGMMHAIDPDDGSELWSFVPQRLLPRMKQLFQNRQSARRIYGLDGDITSTIINDDKRGGITGSERVILSFGMRRGGDSVFALDVTDRDDPQLLWEIDSTTSGFSALGQTWSAPQNGQVIIDGTKHDVLVFGGGYDAGQDANRYQDDSYGNALYMVDVVSGELLWSAGNGNSFDLDLEDMDHSIPAPIRLVDMDADGLVSRMYFGDMGGRVWKIDITNGNTVAELAEGGILASLGAADLESPTVADLRRFYNQADLVNTIHNGKRYMAVNIGSGYRAHPLNRNIDENFFSIRDYNVTSVTATEDYPDADDRLSFADIPDIAGEDEFDVDSAPGWRITLDAAGGEKSLSSSVTYDGTVIFTTFSPTSTATACEASAGNNRLYAVSLFTGQSMIDDPFIELNQGGIAPKVELFYVPEDENGDGEVVAVVGTEEVDGLNLSDPLKRTYWTQDGAE